ncbi:ComEA family DNA-binding protein [Microbacterium sp. SORGH_AS_0862]|uniref:ComEA family DNA-binding protein n=1 Tax=Microbacterium sp. SORGH_AS_0862 TaxID=3041789 RepID=UPI002790FB1D|nr:ComEA family DNA-binding protein [Microbacterium sp. SORGH_AS_0862]MDQ1203690.1 competence protein ComEA [Microbacterium sp. SORGH_AS_0862]
MKSASDAAGRVRLGIGAVIVLALLVLAVTVVVGVLRSAAVPPPVPVATPTAAADVSEVYVHVSGAVAAPGLYVLASGSRVADAISAAGGFGENADTAAVNLARPLSDGEQLVVLEVGQAPPAGAGGGESAGGGPINLNTAGVEQLDELPRIGPAIAQRIVDWREQNGPFTSVDDLLGVAGIGEKMLSGLRDLVTV